MRPRTVPKNINLSDAYALNANEVYTAAQFRQRLGIGDYVFRTWRRAGLPVTALGRKQLILGSEAIEFIRRVHRGEVKIEGT